MEIKVKIGNNADVIDFESYNEIWDHEKWVHLVDEEDEYDDWYATLTSILIDGRKVDLAELDPYAIFCRIYREKLVKLAKEILVYDTDEGICRHGCLPDPAYSKKLREFVQSPNCEESVFKGFDIDKAIARHKLALIERDREQAANIERVWKEICNGTNIIIEFEIACL